MLIRTNDITNKLTWSKNLLTDQTYTGIVLKLNTSGLGFDAVEGLGAADNNNTAVLTTFGGTDVRVIGIMKWVSPTTSPSDEIGVVARLTSLDSPNQTYYYARADGGFARITKVVNGSFTNLTSTAYALSANTLVTITFTIVGNQLSATFTTEAGSPTNVSLSANDSSISGFGICGFRTQSSSIWCRYLSVEQL